MGAAEVVDPATDDPIDAWHRVGGRRAPVVFEAIGVPGSSTWPSRCAAADARRDRRLCMQTDHDPARAPADEGADDRVLLRLRPVEFGDTLRAIAEGEIDVTPMITGVFGIDGGARRRSTRSANPRSR